MAPQVTIIISPRDRYSGLDECIDALYRHTPEPFELWILDLAYPADIIGPLERQLAGRLGVRFFRLGLEIPMDALRKVRDELRTRAVVLLDNDSRVSEGWLPPLMAALDDGHTVVGYSGAT